jgi:hypothetical protein
MNPAPHDQLPRIPPGDPGRGFGPDGNRRGHFARITSLPGNADFNGGARIWFPAGNIIDPDHHIDVRPHPRHAPINGGNDRGTFKHGGSSARTHMCKRARKNNGRAVAASLIRIER